MKQLQTIISEFRENELKPFLADPALAKRVQDLDALLKLIETLLKNLFGFWQTPIDKNALYAHVAEKLNIKQEIAFPDVLSYTVSLIQARIESPNALNLAKSLERLLVQITPEVLNEIKGFGALTWLAAVRAYKTQLEQTLASCLEDLKEAIQTYTVKLNLEEKIKNEAQPPLLSSDSISVSDSKESIASTTSTGSTSTSSLESMESASTSIDSLPSSPTLSDEHLDNEEKTPSISVELQLLIQKDEVSLRGLILAQQVLISTRKDPFQPQPKGPTPTAP